MISLRAGLPLRRAGWRYPVSQLEHPSQTRLVRRRFSPSADVGHVRAGPNETLFFIDNILPLHLRWLPRIPFVGLFPGVGKATPLQRPEIDKISATSPLNLLQRAIPEDLRAKITEIIPRPGEGGAFVKLSHEPGFSGTEVAQQIREHLEKTPIRVWFRLFKNVRAAPVLGRPWVEDLYRLPSPRLKVEFLPTSPDAAAIELTQEELYSLARPYGKLGDIVRQPSDSKVLPRYAYLDFTSPGYATMAKNCLHGFIVPENMGGGKSGTLLKLTYEAKVKGHWIRDWIFGHPRLVIPVLAALIAAFTVFVFDPVRTLFIRMRISPPLSLRDTRIGKWIQNLATRANTMLLFRHHHPNTAGMKAIWEDREEDIRQIRNWLVESSDTFIVVQGPRGSGKKGLVLDGALTDHKKKLLIDCKPIQEAHSDSGIIAAAAAEVGYRPVFSWMNSFSSVIDVASQSAIGAKPGFSQTLDSQLSNILQNTANALKQVALEGRRKKDKDAGLSDDEYLESHAESRPVVIIDNFLYKAGGNQMIYDKLADWAAALTQSNIARVIFLTPDTTYSKVLGRAMPGQVFRQVSLSDCSPEVAKRFVLSHVRRNGEAGEAKDHEDEYTDELDESVRTLGGRLTDLEFLARMVTRGERPRDAVQQIIDQAAAEVLKIFLANPGAESPGKSQSGSRSWSSEHAWDLIKRLGSAPDGTVNYSDILLSDLFRKGAEDAIRDLEQAELISLTSLNGRPSQIKAGKPVYNAGFKRLLKDDVLRCRMDLAVLNQLIAMENVNINKYEAELQVLGSPVPKTSWEIDTRVKWLLAKLMSSQKKVERYEKETAILKEALKGRD